MQTDLKATITRRDWTNIEKGRGAVHPRVDFLREQRIRQHAASLEHDVSIVACCFQSAFSQ
jgi:hypothetical protein